MSVLPPPPYDLVAAAKAAEEKVAAELRARTDALETRAYDAIVRLSALPTSTRGAKWEDVVKACGLEWDNSPDYNAFEDLLCRMMDAGRIYEPTLGWLKPT